MENNYAIEKDNILNCYIVWEVHRNYKINRFKSKLKEDCEKWVEKKVKHELKRRNVCKNR